MRINFYLTIPFIIIIAVLIDTNGYNFLDFQSSDWRTIKRFFKWMVPVSLFTGNLILF